MVATCCWVHRILETPNSPKYPGRSFEGQIWLASVSSHRSHIAPRVTLWMPSATVRTRRGLLRHVSYTSRYRGLNVWLECMRLQLASVPVATCNSPWLLWGSWVVISRVISRVTILITHIRGLVTPLITTHEPPSTFYGFGLRMETREFNRFAGLILSQRPATPKGFSWRFRTFFGRLNNCLY